MQDFLTTFLLFIVLLIIMLIFGYVNGISKKNKDFERRGFARVVFILAIIGILLLIVIFCALLFFGNAMGHMSH